MTRRERPVPSNVSVEREAERQMDRMLTAYVESLLAAIWGGDELFVDDDGDYPFRHGTAAAWVSVVTGQASPGVRVFADAAINVPKSAKLLAEINDVNSRRRFVTVAYRDGVVWVEASLLWVVVGRMSLQHLMDHVAETAADLGPMIATVFGGETPFDADDETEAAGDGSGSARGDVGEADSGDEAA